jgi:hypothetical protein
MSREGNLAGMVSTCMLGLAAGLQPNDSIAQLAECMEIDQLNRMNAAGGCIDKTLERQIGTGHGDEHQPGSAVYLIKRDPARSIRRGRQLFQRKFSLAEGLGPRVNLSSMGDLFGLGLIEMLGDEMTRDLRRIRDEAVAAATGGARSQAATRKPSFDAMEVRPRPPRLPTSR